MPKSTSRRAAQWTAVAASAAVVTAVAAFGSASAASGNSSPRVAVPQGVNPAVFSSAEVTGTTSSSTQMRVAFILKVRHETALSNKVESGWTGRYLTTHQFAAEYGQPQSVVSGLVSYLHKYGIKTTSYADHLDVAAQGTSAEFTKALKIFEKNYTVAATSSQAAQHVYGSTVAPSLPKNAAFSSQVLTILGLSNYKPFSSTAVKAVGQRAGAQTVPSAGKGVPAGMLSPANFESEYDLSAVLKAGHKGQGQTLGIVTLASVNPRVPEYFWSKVLGLKTAANRLKLDNIDGGAGAVSLKAGSDETTLDVEQSGSIAPDAKIIVYQAPNTDNGFADAFYTAASDNVVGSVSASWGESESIIKASVLSGTETRYYQAAFDEAYMEMGAQGQSSFASAGDEGAFTATKDLGTSNAVTDSPADSPYTTSAGGTTNPGTQKYSVVNKAKKVVATEAVSIPAQQTWNWGYLWPMYKAFGGTSARQLATDPKFGFIGGGGGGYSQLESEPIYQRKIGADNKVCIVHYLTPDHRKPVKGTNGKLVLATGFAYKANPTITCAASTTTTASTGTGTAAAATANGSRVEPDLAFNADPQTGYAVYDPQFKAVYGSNFAQYGGTSFVAPQLNAVTADFESAVGHRIGFWNPTIYKAAASSSSPFTPLKSSALISGHFTNTPTGGSSSVIPGSFSNNDNYYTGDGRIYNAAAGLGYANLDKLLKAFK